MTSAVWLRRFLWVLAGGFLYYLAFFNVPAPEPFRVSPETTFFTEPLMPDGSVDFAQALNRRSGPVAPVDNVVIPLMHMIGPDNLPTGTAAAALSHLLGESLPGPEARGFQPLEKFSASVSASSSALVDLPPATSSAGQKQSGSRDLSNVLLKELCQKPWLPDEYPVVAAWIAANEKGLRLFADAGGRQKFWWPLLPGASFVEFGNIPLFRSPVFLQAHRSMCARAMQKLGMGDSEGSLTDLLDAMRVSRHLAGMEFMVVKLIGTISLNTTLYACETWINNASPTAEQCDRLMTGMSALKPLPDCQNVFELEYRISPSAMVTTLAREGLGKRSPGGKVIKVEDFLDYNRLSQRFGQTGASFCALLAEPDLVTRSQGLENWVKQLDVRRAVTPGQILWRSFDIVFLTTRWKKVAAVTDLMADILSSLSVPNFLNVIHETDALAVRFDLTLLAVALKKHQITTGSFPASLTGGYPGLASVPADPFSRAPLQFRLEKEGAVIYSVGPNLKDDGGSDNRENIAHDGDIAVRLSR